MNDWRGPAEFVIVLAFSAVIVIVAAGLVFWNREIGDRGYELVFPVVVALAMRLKGKFGRRAQGKPSK